ncbi:hypothetical protein FNL55_03955 [Tardiphaga sp. vice352]|uniref:DUF6894 family protein n=1 Tax=unclassified Tardiphaga TaxID=2631404 RepID=UPI001164D360|nr:MULTISPECIES: hypothetical protein [unclassified Tardiphaga]QDM15219.1 hypothetical protein FNL53_04015 [Tardiphaga sp. vice278]QDM25388.1 hypothetical protein FNL56_03880 [Tardiphaga sp. vice304]QDM30598.1 hypothetical protein FNL55_03955 [Tardiphaga sp. vice352]
MPMYFFDLTDDAKDNHANDMGVELAADEVPDEAVAFLATVARDRLPGGCDRAFHVSVRDASGGVVFEAQLTLKSGWL